MDSIPDGPFRRDVACYVWKALESGPETLQATSLPSFHLCSGRCFQFLNLANTQPPEFAGRDIQAERSISHTLDLFDVVPDLLEHAPDLAVLTFDQRDLIPGIFGFANQANFRWCRFHSLRPPPLRDCGSTGVPARAFTTARRASFRNRQTSPKFLQSRLIGCSCHFYDVGLRHMRRGFHQALGKFAVVGEEQQT